MHIFWVFFGTSLFFCLFFLPSHPAQASACRSSGLFFHQIPLSHPLPSYCPDEQQALVWLSSNTVIPSHSPTHSAQTSYKHSSGLFLSLKPITSASLTSPISPDECLSLVWAFFSRIPSFVSPTISYSPDERQALVWALFSLDLSSDPDELQALVWLHFRHGLFPPRFHISLSTSSSPDERQALVWAILFTSFTSTLHLHHRYDLNQPRRATSTRLGYLFAGTFPLTSSSPDELQALVWLTRPYTLLTSTRSVFN